MDDTKKCDHCDETLTIKHDEMTDTDSCASCGIAYLNCGRCGETVSENEWNSGVTMCNNCWDATCDQTD